MVVIFAAMDVRDVELDDRPLEHLERIEKGDRRERIAGRIDDDARAVVGRFVDPVDELLLAVRLAENDGLVARRPAAFPLDLGERRLAVDFRLPTTEPVEVRAVEDVQRRGVSVGHGR
jgi:hypothetical protein